MRTGREREKERENWQEWLHSSLRKDDCKGSVKRFIDEWEPRRSDKDVEDVEQEKRKKIFSKQEK